MLGHKHGNGDAYDRLKFKGNSMEGEIQNINKAHEAAEMTTEELVKEINKRCDRGNGSRFFIFMLTSMVDVLCICTATYFAVVPLLLNLLRFPPSGYDFRVTV